MPCSNNTLQEIKNFCAPGINAGLISEKEFKELYKLAKSQESDTTTKPELQLFTRKEAADKLKISIRQLDRYHEAGYIKYIRIGIRALRIPSESLFYFMEHGSEVVTNEN